MPLRLMLAGLAAAAMSCDGAIEAPPIAPIKSPVSEPSACTGQANPGPAPIRRLTRQEYDRTLRDLAGDTTHPAAEFGAEEEALGFTNNAAALVTSSALVDKYLTASEGIARRLSADLGRVKGYACRPEVQGEDVCAGQFIDAFAMRAFRRPITRDEREAMLGLFATGRTLGGLDADQTPLSPFTAGIQLLIEGLLQSPDFLYRVELGAQTDPSKPAPLTSFELANRLSYLLWGSMPDEALLQAAAAGHLQQPAEISAQATRLLADAHAHETVVEFHREWLDFDRVANVGKAAAVYPNWSAAIPTLMQQETTSFIEQVVFDGEGTWDALLTAPYSMMSPDLASFYGVKTPNPSNPAFQKVALDPAQRSGLLTQGSLLSINAHSNQTSPVHRGKLIRESFLCDVLSPPPKNVMIVVPEPQANSTARERFALHSSNPACSACHTLMDPLGFPFEKLDGTGVFRSTENGKPIDDSGEISASDVPGPFNGVPGLAGKLVSSAQARHCYVKQWFRYAYGRGETLQDACTLERLDTQFNQNGRDVKKLLLSLTQSDAFLYRPAQGVTP